jgi:diphthine-ammonia ligase
MDDPKLTEGGEQFPSRQRRPHDDQVVRRPPATAPEPTGGRRLEQDTGRRGVMHKDREADAVDTPAAGTPFVCSWSGGKDSCLAIHRAISAGARPAALLTILDEGGERSRSHGLTVDVLRAQSAALGIPLITRRASWEAYEPTFIAALRELREAGVQAGVFGDVDLEEHRQWEEKVCAAAGITAYLPLWQRPRRALLDELLALGFEAMVIATKDDPMGHRYLGRTLDAELIQEFERIEIDLCGEAGEYHTVVTDGPIFVHRLALRTGERTLHSGYWFLNVQVVGPAR